MRTPGADVDPTPNAGRGTPNADAERGTPTPNTDAEHGTPNADADTER
jgi:hypothetical protein